MEFRTTWVLAVPEATRRISRGTAAITESGDSNAFGILDSGRLLLPESVGISRASQKVGEESGPPWPDLLAVIPWATHARWNEPAATYVAATLGGTVTQRRPKPYGGFALRTVSIAGDIAPLPYKDAQFMALLADTAASGKEPGYEATFQFVQTVPEAYRMLLQCVRLVNTVAETPGMVLHLYSIDDGRYYVVEPLSRALIRGTPNRMGMRYEFHFRALEEVEPPVVQAYRTVMPETGNAENWLTKAVEYLETGIAVANEAVAVIEGITALADSVIRDAANYGRAIARTFQDAANAINDLVHLPARAVSAVQGIGDGFNEALMTLRDTFATASTTADPDFEPGGDASPIPTDAVSSVLSRQIRDVSARLDQLDDLYCRSIASIRVNAIAGRSTTQVKPVMAGQSLADISTDIFGVPDYWDALARLNGLRFPYISEGGEPGTLRPGDKILLPETATGSGSTMAAPWVDIDERLFGKGIRLTAGGDWALRPDNTGVDYVVGLECVQQGLRVRMDTEQGANPAHPSMGLPRVLGEEVQPGQSQAMVIAAMWQLRRDDRVRAIRNHRVVDNGNVLGFEADCVLVNAESVGVGPGR